MPSSEYATAVSKSNYGNVTASVKKILVVEVEAINIEMDRDVTEVHIAINGRTFSRMRPERARRLGMVSLPDQW